jgi:hypothetical protein
VKKPPKPPTTQALIDVSRLAVSCYTDKKSGSDAWYFVRLPKDGEARFCGEAWLRMFLTAYIQSKLKR